MYPSSGSKTKDTLDHMKQLGEEYPGQYDYERTKLVDEEGWTEKEVREKYGDWDE